MLKKRPYLKALIKEKYALKKNGVKKFVGFFSDLMHPEQKLEEKIEKDNIDKEKI